MEPLIRGHHLASPVGPRDHATGSEQSAITLIEYGDYECEFCNRAYPMLKNVRRKFGDKLRYVFRNFPLSDIHPHAEVAAEVAEAAAEQGRFWEMHDMLFEHPNALELEHLLDYARKLGLDVKRVVAELEGRIYLPRIREDYESGRRTGVIQTPGFFINGELFDGDWSAPDFLEALTGHAR